MNGVSGFVAGVLVAITAVMATMLAGDCHHGGAVLGTQPIALGVSGSGSAAVFETAVDEAKANKLFHDAHGKDACHTKTGRLDCAAALTLVANCTDGTQVYAPAALYVRGRPDTGGYTRRNTDPDPIVVPLSYDWCAP